MKCFCDAYKSQACTGWVGHHISGEGEREMGRQTDKVSETVQNISIMYIISLLDLILDLLLFSHILFKLKTTLLTLF